MGAQNGGEVILYGVNPLGERPAPFFGFTLSPINTATVTFVSAFLTGTLHLEYRTPVIHYHFLNLLIAS